MSALILWTYANMHTEWHAFKIKFTPDRLGDTAVTSRLHSVHIACFL